MENTAECVTVYFKSIAANALEYSEVPLLSDFPEYCCYAQDPQESCS
jgi:hypothetical protein